STARLFSLVTLSMAAASCAHAGAGPRSSAQRPIRAAKGRIPGKRSAVGIVGEGASTSGAAIPAEVPPMYHGRAEFKRLAPPPPAKSQPWPYNYRYVDLQALQAGSVAGPLGGPRGRALR